MRRAAPNLAIERTYGRSSPVLAGLQRTPQLRNRHAVLSGRPAQVGGVSLRVKPVGHASGALGVGAAIVLIVVLAQPFGREPERICIRCLHVGY
jgi:hypothetical protein